MLASGEEPAKIEESVKSVATMLGKLKDSPIASHEKVTAMTEDDFSAMFASMGTELGEFLNNPAMGNDMPEFDKVVIGEPVIDGDKATVSVETDKGDEETVELIKIDGKWYFDLSEPLAEMRDELGEMKKMSPQEAMQIKGMINGMVAPMLKNFEDVESQEDFDEAFQKSFGLFMMLGGGGPGGGMGGGPGGGGFGR